MQQLQNYFVPAFAAVMLLALVRVIWKARR